MASFDFFRRHQKVILYTAGIFALVTFSVTGAMTTFFDDMFRPPFKGATMTLADGRPVWVTEEDHLVAQQIVNTEQRLGGDLLLPPVIPSVGVGPDTRTHRTEILAALRRLAIEYGLGTSEDEAVAAVEGIARVLPRAEGAQQPTIADVARAYGCTPDQYILLMRESLRIGTFLRLFAFAADVSDAELAAEIVRRMKLLTLRVATLDKKAIEAELGKAEVGDDALRAWLEALPDAEKVPFQDTNRVALRLAGLKLDGFDPAAFATELAGKEFPEQAVTDRYNLDREQWYRREKKENEEPGQDPYIPLADVKDQIVKRLQIEHVLEKVLDKVRDAMATHVRAAVEARTQASQALAKAKEDQAAADKAVVEKPGEAPLVEAAAKAKDATAAAEQALKDASAAVDAARKAFDLHAATAAATTAGLVLAAVPEPKNADELKELPEFGTWDASWAAVSIELAGDLGTRVQHTKAGAFLFQVSDLVKTPLKEFDKIRDQVREAYFKKKADEAAKEQLAKFDAARERLAREARKTEIEAAEAEHTAAVTKEFDAWKAAQEAAKVRAEAMKAQLASDPQSAIYQQWTKKLESINAELADAEGKRKAIEAAQRAKTDARVKDILRTANKDVLAAAAAEAGLTVETVGPYRKDLDMQPRFQDAYPARVRFLFSQQAVKDLKEGESTEVLEDVTNRAHHLAVMEKVEPGTLAHVTRRDLALERDRFRQERTTGAVAQSFTIEALRQRWGYRSVDVDVVKPAPGAAGTGGTAPAGGEGGPGQGGAGQGEAPREQGSDGGRKDEPPKDPAPDAAKKDAEKKPDSKG